MICGWGRSLEKGNPLQYFGLENPMDGEAWWTTVHGVTKSWTRLRDFTFTSFSSVQFIRSVVSGSATPWTAAHQASQSIINFQSLLKLMPIESVMPSNHLILYCPLLLPPSLFPSIRVFSSHHQSQFFASKVLEFHLQHQSFQ